MEFNVFRGCFKGADQRISLDQFRALTIDELNGLIEDANLSRPDAGQARLFYGSSGNFHLNVHIIFFVDEDETLKSFLSSFSLSHLIFLCCLPSVDINFTGPTLSDGERFLFQ